jgi:hypothetical protein
MAESIRSAAVAVVVAALAAGQFVVGSAASFAQAPAAGITDKTLVAWVYPANLEQRGGAVVTLMDRAEHFDAIVLGEMTPGKWMAGSDFFRRTPRDQSAYPVESANEKTCVMVAAVYQGNHVRIYRHGKPYASYPVERPQAFGPDAFVLIGLRYLGSMGAIGPFAGAVEEARLYNTALDEKTMASLQPNSLGDPKPLAQWTFEDGTANDAMKAFPPGELCGGARIAGGKLHLNGKDAYMISERQAADSQLMFYKPRSRQTGRLWDTWLYLHEGTYDLYYLAKCGPEWDNISMATSPDGVHWKEVGRILSKGEGVTWMGTGSTWRSPRFAKDGRFLMNFSEWRGPRQTIFFAESKDLVHWTRLGNEYEFRQDTRWYNENGRWDCIWTIPRPEGGLYGYWTADPKGRPGVGFGWSADGLKWEALEPPQFEGGAPHGEAGAVEKVGDTYYLMLGAGGMLTLVADAPQGPFRPAKKNSRLLFGHTYFSRFFPTPGGLLVNHHSIARNGEVYMGTLKRALVDAEGTMRLAWWEGNDKLKREAIDLKQFGAGDASGARVVMLDSLFDVAGGVVLEGHLPVPKSKEAKPAGLYVACGQGQGAAILVGAGGVTDVGLIQADGSGFKGENRVDRETPFGPTARFRLLLKHSLLEFYLDDVLMHCYSLPAWATGRIGLVGGEGNRLPADLKAWRP